MTKEQKKWCNGPIGFWFLNGDIDKDKIIFQLDEFVEKGFAGVAAHPRHGLKVPYLSKSWFEGLNFIFDQCQKRNLEFWFYDENGYPSGSVGGQLLSERPDLAARPLNFKIDKVKAKDGRIKLSYPKGLSLMSISALELDKDSKQTDKLHDLNGHAGMLNEDWFVQGTRNIGYGPITTRDETDVPHVRSWQINNAWHIDWPAKENTEYLIIAAFRPMYGQAKANQYVDMLNKETVEIFRDMSYQRSSDELGDKRFAQSTAIFTDEPSVNGPYPYSETLNTEYQKRYGCKLRDVLPHLVVNINKKSPTIRYQYRRLIAEIFNENFTKTLHQFCVSKKIPFTGHISPEEDLIVMACANPGLIISAKTMDWPGYDLITRPFGDAEWAKLIGPKLIASIARQYNKEHIMAEALGCCGDDLTIDYMYRIVCWLAICGYDKFVIHGQFYSLEGNRKREAPPSIFYQAPYWRNFAHLSRLIEDLSTFNNIGEVDRKIAIVMPNSTFEASFPVDTIGAIHSANNIAELLKHLIAAGYDIDFISDYFIDDIQINGRILSINKAQYDIVIIPDIKFASEKLVSAMNQWQEQGICVKSLSQEIYSVDGSSIFKPKQEYLNAKELTISLPGELKLPIIEIVSGRVYTQRRYREKGSTTMIWNPQSSLATVIIDKNSVSSLSTFDKSEIILSQPANDNMLELRLQPFQMVIVECKPAIATLLPSISTRKIVSSSSLSFTMEPMTKENVLLLSIWNLKMPDGATHKVRLPAKTGQLPCGLKGYILTAQTDFICNNQIEQLKLAWDNLCFAGNYQIKVNDRLLDLNNLTSNEHQVETDIQKYVKSGRNNIEIQVGPILSSEAAILEPICLKGSFKVIRSDMEVANVVDVRPEWFKEYLEDDIIVPSITSTNWLFTAGKDLDWTKNGFCQYSGSFTYRTKVNVKLDKDCEYWLEFGKDQQDPVEVYVNSQHIATKCWKPFQFNITDFLRQNINDITLISSNTSINVIEGKHSPSGIIGVVKLKVYETNNTIESPCREIKAEPLLSIIRNFTSSC